MSPRFSLLAAALLLAGCSTLPPPAEIPHELAAPTAPGTLPEGVMDRDAAARLALQRHPQLRAAEAAWRAERAELRQALSPSNPSLAFGRARIRTTHEGAIETEWENEWGLHLPLAGWLSAWLNQDARRAWGEQQQQQAQAQWLLQLDQGGRAARRAQLQAVAAAQLLREQELAWDAARSAAELARRLYAAGNFSKLQWLRWEQAFAQQQLALAQAQEQAQAARAQLAQQLGLWTPAELAALHLPEALPDLPETPPSELPTEAEAVSQRLDLRAARAGALLRLAQVGIANAESWLQGLSLGLEASTERGPDAVSRMRRVELEWQLPLFDGGAARREAAKARAEQTAWQLQAQAQGVRAQLRAAVSAVQHAWDRANHHRQQLQPLQQQISDEMLLRWNGMFEGPFELLQDAQARLAARRAAIEAQRDYWLAWERVRQVRWSPIETVAAPAAAAAAPAKTDAH
jgi:outer membrane protein TolC